MSRDALPSRLPFNWQQFDLIIAFSVFTYLSERATVAALNLLNGALTDTGILAIIIRPVEYWRIHHGLSQQNVTALE